MSFVLKTLTVQRATYVEDASGQETPAWASVLALNGIQATFNFYRRVSFKRMEEGTHNTQGPSIATSTVGFFKFVVPFPSVQINDRLIDPDGVAWRVFKVRAYSLTMQVDVESVA